MSTNRYTKLKWYRFNIARRIRNLEGEELIAELEDIIEDIKEKKLDKLGVFKIQLQELENMIAELKEKPKAKGRQYDPFYIPISGDGRIALFGLSNVGKSTLMNAITNTDVKTGAYLHTTREALAGTCEYEDIRIQIVDLPGFLDFREDWNTSKQIVRVTRTSDAIMMVIDLSMDIDRQYNFLMKQLEDSKLIVNGETPYKLSIIATKGDLVGSKERYQELLSKTDLPVCPITIKSEESLEKLREALFQQLDVIRVYTKKPGGRVEYGKPFVLPEGTIVADVTKRIHTSFLQNFRYGRVWGTSVDHEGQHVGLEHELADKDVLEIVVSRK
ncbi:MAG: TGS domain-containing protein [Candidatus Heimdallarchaeota archaeon]|nr:TGS domain-containing protein [Candidatus Heimdallarchaeota archaeon]